MAWVLKNPLSFLVSYHWMKCDLLELLNFTHAAVFYCPTRQAATRVFHFQMNKFRVMKIAHNALMLLRGR